MAISGVRYLWLATPIGTMNTLPLVAVWVRGSRDPVRDAMQIAWWSAELGDQVADQLVSTSKDVPPLRLGRSRSEQSALAAVQHTLDINAAMHNLATSPRW